MPSTRPSSTAPSPPSAPRAPLEGRPGYDLQAQALTGFMARAGDGEPLPGPVPVTDTALPLLACAAILAALVSRATTGRGQLVDASLLGTAVALNAHSLVRIDDLPGHGVRTFSRAFFRPYRTADGWLVVAAYAERLARSFCEAIGLPGLLDEPPWDDRAVRVEREAELVALVAPRMRERTDGRVGAPARRRRRPRLTGPRARRALRRPGGPRRRAARRGPRPRAGRPHHDRAGAPPLRDPGRDPVPGPPAGTGHARRAPRDWGAPTSRSTARERRRRGLRA